MGLGLSTQIQCTRLCDSTSHRMSFILNTENDTRSDRSDSMVSGVHVDHNIYVKRDDIASLGRRQGEPKEKSKATSLTHHPKIRVHLKAQKRTRFGHFAFLILYSSSQ